MKTEITKNIEKIIFEKYNDKHCRGITAVLECPIGTPIYNEYGTVDAISYNQTKDEFTCFEIKVSVSDFHSKAKLTFVGNRNYYVMPLELYNKVKDEIPKDIGVQVLCSFEWEWHEDLGYNRKLVDGNTDLLCIKKCKKRELQVPKELLLCNMLRSARNKSSLKILRGE